jgi:HD-GYP domain-containing protein (c-di-GMP phosphodiesterase class II)
MEQRARMEKQLMFEGFTHSLILTIDAKDPYTRGHSERVAIYAKMLAEAANLGPEMMELAYRCGRVHDIGKINVPGDLLRKPSRLTAEEFAQITVHPEASYKILHPIPQMRDVLPGVLEHHEKWDGSGYPNKLVGEKISVLGRIIGIADCFDAMTSSRAYRPAREIGEVLVEIEKCLGKHFDPELGKVFLSIPVHKLLEHIVTASPAQAEQKSI